jgi:hypothetical protein
MPRPFLLLLVLTAGVLAAGSTAEARYRPLTLDALLGQSDLVLVGEITRLEAEQFELTISETLAGNHKSSTIVIQRFKNWPCASRWAPYEVGQKVLICLHKVVDEKSGSVTCKIRSGGGEGEMPIVAGVVHSRGVGVKDVPIERCQVYGKEVSFWKFTLENIRARVKSLRETATEVTPK